MTGKEHSLKRPIIEGEADMIVRKIKPEEFKRTEELFSIAFCFPYDNEKGPMETYQDKKDNPEAREDVRILDKYAAFEDDNKTMMSCFSATRFPMNFNGNEVTMIGIGGVSTVPTYRRQGGIRGCFTKMLPEVYKEGAVFSYLYPFSTCFYNKFGYGLGIRGKVYELDLSRIPKYGTRGKSILIEQENCQEKLEDIATVYEVWQRKYNGMIINGPLEYQFISNANPFKKQEFVYLYCSADGIPKGYISFHKEDSDGGRILACTKIVFTDAEGLMGLLELTASYAADYRSVRFTVPEDIEIEAVLKEFSFGACKLNRSYMGMVRVINVEEALRLSSYHGDGNIALQITDPYIEENTGVFQVIYQEGKAKEVSRVSETTTRKKENTSVIAMHIDRFSEFIFQNRPASDFLYYGEQSLTEEEVRKLEQTFVRRTSFLMEYF